VKGVAGSLHLDVESHFTENIRSSYRSIDGDGSPSDLQQCVCSFSAFYTPLKNVDLFRRPPSVDGKFSPQLPYVSRSPLSESRPISRAETIGSIFRSLPDSPGNLSPAILYASPIGYSGSEAGTTASPVDEIHGTVAEQDDVEFEEEQEQASPSSVHTDKFVSVISPAILLTIP